MHEVWHDYGCQGVPDDVIRELHAYCGGHRASFNIAGAVMLSDITSNRLERIKASTTWKLWLCEYQASYQRRFRALAAFQRLQSVLEDVDAAAVYMILEVYKEKKDANAVMSVEKKYADHLTKMLKAGLLTIAAKTTTYSPGPLLMQELLPSLLPDLAVRTDASVDAVIQSLIRASVPHVWTAYDLFFRKKREKAPSRYVPLELAYQRALELVVMATPILKLESEVKVEGSTKRVDFVLTMEDNTRHCLELVAHDRPGSVEGHIQRLKTDDKGLKGVQSFWVINFVYIDVEADYVDIEDPDHQVNVLHVLVDPDHRHKAPVTKLHLESEDKSEAAREE